MRSLCAALLTAIFVVSPAAAQGLGDMVDFSGYIESDTRVILDDYRGLNPGGRLFALGYYENRTVARMTNH